MSSISSFWCNHLDVYSGFFFQIAFFAFNDSNHIRVIFGVWTQRWNVYRLLWSWHRTYRRRSNGVISSVKWHPSTHPQEKFSSMTHSSTSSIKSIRLCVAAQITRLAVDTAATTTAGVIYQVPLYFHIYNRNKIMSCWINMKYINQD